jgi:hypothetical protein
MLKKKVYIKYIYLLNFCYSNPTKISSYSSQEDSKIANNKYLILSPYQKNIFEKITNKDHNELLEYFHLTYKFNDNLHLLNILTSIIVLYKINDFSQEDVSIDEEKIINNYKNYLYTYIIINNLIFYLYTKYKYEEFIEGSILEKISFLLSFIGVYFTIKNLLHMILVASKKNIQIEQDFYKNMEDITLIGDLLQLTSFIFSLYGNMYFITKKKINKMEKFEKILFTNKKNQNGETFYLNNKDTQSILASCTV